MAQSPSVNANADLVNLEVMIGGTQIKIDDDIFLFSVEINKEINRIHTAEIYILDGNLYDYSEEGGVGFTLLDDKLSDFKPGKDVTIKAGYRTDSREEIFKGIITKTGIRVKDRNHTLLFVEASHKAVKTTLNRKSKYFLKKDDKQIVQQVASDAGLSFSTKGTMPNYKHKEVVQYNATDWDFMVSRAEANGLLIIPDDVDPSKIWMVEPTKNNSTPVELTFGVDFNKANLMLDGHTQLKEVNCSAWDPNTQKMVESKSKTTPDSLDNNQADSSLDGKKLANDILGAPTYFHSNGQMEKKELQNWATARLTKSRLSRIRGTIMFQGNSDVKLNDFVNLKDTGKFFDGKAYVTRINHHIREGNWLTEVGIGLSSDLFTESKPNIQLPPAGGLLPGIEGLVIGKVKKIHDDPDKEYRVQVDIPVIDPSGDGIWARMIHFLATSNKTGAFFYPQVGDEVILAFLNNDPRYPVILGKMYSKKNKPPYSPDAQNSTQAILTKNKLLLEFNDKDKVIVIETPGGQRITLSDKDKKILIEDSNQNKITLDNQGIEMKSMKKIILDANGNIEMKSKMGKITATANAGDVKLKGLNFTGEGTMAAKVKGNMSADVTSTGMTSVKGSVVFIN